MRIVKMSFKDKTFCASPNCNNECGRKMSDAEKQQLGALQYNLNIRSSLDIASADYQPNLTVQVSYAYFCGE